MASGMSCLLAGVKYLASFIVHCVAVSNVLQFNKIKWLRVIISFFPFIVVILVELKAQS